MIDYTRPDRTSTPTSGIDYTHRTRDTAQAAARAAAQAAAETPAEPKDPRRHTVVLTGNQEVNVTRLSQQHAAWAKAGR